MAPDRLGGLHRIDELYLEPIEDEPGMYVFYRTRGGPVRYVGRSDTSLRHRIARRPYTYFRYKHTYDDEDAYYWECVYWHRYIETIDNCYTHPARPAGYYDLECPICDY